LLRNFFKSFYCALICGDELNYCVGDYIIIIAFSNKAWKWILYNSNENFWTELGQHMCNKKPAKSLVLQAFNCFADWTAGQ